MVGKKYSHYRKLLVLWSSTEARRTTALVLEWWVSRESCRFCPRALRMGRMEAGPDRPRWGGTEEMGCVQKKRKNNGGQCP